MRPNSFPRPASMLLAALIGACTIVCTARATTSHNTPDITQTNYTLNAGTNSANITPPAGVPVYICGVCTTTGDRGAGHVSLLHSTGGGLAWEGTNSPSLGTGTSGNTSTAGSAIVAINFAGNVTIQVASADAIQVHNGSAAKATGSVKMMF